MAVLNHSTWVLNDGISYPEEEIFQGLIFTANGESYSAIRVTTESIFYVNDSGTVNPVGQTALMSIELADGEQTVSDAFLYWFIWNFTKQEAPPVIALSGNTLRISEVNGATGYNLYVNGSYLMVTSNFEIDLESALSNYEAGEYTVHVTVDIDGSESEPSNSVSYTISDAPTISISGVIVTVSLVDGAMGYRLYVDGEQISETIENEFDLSSLLDGYAAGDYSITATAYFDNDIDPITETAQSNAITYTIEEPIEELYTIRKTTLSGIADAIRLKTGKTEQIDAANFASEIESISSGESSNLNISYGDTPPDDTSKLWIKGEKGNTIVKTDIDSTIKATSIGTFDVHLYDGAFSQYENYLYIFGGAIKDGSAQSKIYRYDLETNETTILTPNGATFPVVTGAASSSIVDGSIYIFGGRNSSNTLTSKIYKYTISTNTLELLSVNIEAPMDSMTSQAVGTDIYIFGGNYGSSPNGNIYKFDTVNNTYTYAGVTLRVPAFGVSSKKLPNGKILIFGGYDTAKGVYPVHVYDPFTNTCTDSNTCIRNANGRVSGNGYNLFVSPWTNSENGYRAYTYNYRDGFVKTHDDIQYCMHLGHTAFYKNKVYCVSSYTNQDVVTYEETFPLSKANYCVEIGNAGHEINLFGNAFLHVSRVFVGDENGNAKLAEAYSYDTVLQKWLNVSNDEEYTPA